MLVVEYWSSRAIPTEYKSSEGVYTLMDWVEGFMPFLGKETTKEFLRNYYGEGMLFEAVSNPKNYLTTEEYEAMEFYYNTRPDGRICLYETVTSVYSNGLEEVNFSGRQPRVSNYVDMKNIINKQVAERRQALRKRLLKEAEELTSTLPARVETHSVGDGEWSLEVYDSNDNFIREFVGSNGTRYGEEASDLWEEYHEWCNTDPKILSTEAKIKALDERIKGLK